MGDAPLRIGIIGAASELRAFVAYVRGDGSVPTDAANGVANMRSVDAIYDGAGMKQRGR